MSIYPNIKRIVTSQRGSWRWQNAFRIATYEARLDRNGVMRYWSVDLSPKYSEPQLRRAGIDYIKGSAHRFKTTDIAELWIHPGDTFLEGQ